MLRSLSRAQAAALALLALALLAWSLTIGPVQAPSASAPTEAYSDLKLYCDTAEAVHGGEPYYAAAARLQRLHDFPTRPFATIRLPTLTWLAAALGLPALHVLMLVLVLANAVAWYAAGRRPAAAERCAVALFTLAGSAMALPPEFALKHEVWAGLLVSLAIVLQSREHWRAALLLIATALAFRELAASFLPIALAVALYRRRWCEAGAWVLLGLLFAIALAFHAHGAAANVRPGDLGSQGWLGLRGPAAPLRDLVDVSLLNRVPAPLCYGLAMASLLGLLGAPPRVAAYALPFTLIILALLAICARPVNFYWTILILPTALIGLAFLPRAAGDLVRALRRPPLAGVRQPL